jgi:DNA-binding NarL/FixJ family response regulator
MAVGGALPGAKVIMADNEQQLDAVLASGADLLLFNRVLEFGFQTRQGQELLEKVRADKPEVPVMMVSNFAEAQQAAEAAGAKPGFGKNEIGQPQVTDRLRAAIES